MEKRISVLRRIAPLAAVLYFNPNNPRKFIVKLVIPTTTSIYPSFLALCKFLALPENKTDNRRIRQYKALVENPTIATGR